MRAVVLRGMTRAALGAALLLAGGVAAAEDAPARQLLDGVRTLNQTSRKWDDRVQQMKLTIVDRRGNESQRELEILTKRYGDDASRSIMFFRSPPMVRGIGFLQWIAPREPDRQWLYLPSLKRTRQISGGSRTDSFAGTDFSYEDLSIMADVLDWGPESAAASLKGSETLDGQECDIVELTPTEVADVTYGAIRLWLCRGDQVVHKYEFADAKGALAKTLVMTDVRDVNGIPAAHRLDMRNARTGSHTMVELTALQYNTGLADDVFTQRRLEKGAS